MDMELRYSPHFTERLIERFSKTIDDIILSPSNVEFIGWSRNGCYKIWIININAVVVVSLSGIAITIYPKD
jgi:hypothetical protein